MHVGVSHDTYNCSNHRNMLRCHYTELDEQSVTALRQQGLNTFPSRVWHTSFSPYLFLPKMYANFCFFLNFTAFLIIFNFGKEVSHTPATVPVLQKNYRVTTESVTMQEQGTKSYSREKLAVLILAPWSTTSISHNATQQHNTIYYQIINTHITNNVLFNAHYNNAYYLFMLFC